MKVIYKDSIVKVQQALVDDLADYIADNRGQKLLLFYSGGSALELLPCLQGALINREVSQLDAWFSPIDERFDRSVSNFQAFISLECSRFYEHLGVRFLDVLSHGHSLEDCGYWFSEWARVEMDQVHVNDGKVISILGMGPDGHTAGIFPYPENEIFFNGEFINTGRFATGYDAGNKNQYRERITLTVPALKVVDRSFGYVTGNNKSEALKRAVENGNVASTPAALWNELNDIIIYTDINL